MDGWKIFEKSPPMTRRKSIAYWSFNASCVLTAALLAGYHAWAIPSLYDIKEVDVRRISVIVFRCSQDHFWGHRVYYTEPQSGPWKYGLETIGNACRDWKAGQWVLARDVLRQ